MFLFFLHLVPVQQQHTAADRSQRWSSLSVVHTQLQQTLQFTETPQTLPLPLYIQLCGKKEVLCFCSYLPIAATGCRRQDPKLVVHSYFIFTAWWRLSGFAVPRTSIPSLLHSILDPQYSIVNPISPSDLSDLTVPLTLHESLCLILLNKSGTRRPELTEFVWIYIYNNKSLLY